MRRYLTLFFAAALVPLALFGAFNLLIDPYDTQGAPALAGVNEPKSHLNANERIYKTVRLARDPAQVVLLGTSRTDRGLDPEDPVFQGASVRNLAMQQQPYSEARALLDHLEPGVTRQVVFGLDFFVANDLLEKPESISPDNFSATRGARLLLAMSTVSDSISTLRHAREGDALGTNRYSGDGLWDYDFRIHREGNRRAFLGSEAMYLRDLYLPQPQCRFALDAPRTGRSQMAELREFLAQAHRRRLDVRLFISPSHARQWETLGAAGLWPDWEQWKRDLVAMNDEEARKAHQAAFPLWDFSGYNVITTESVPALDDRSHLMHYYLDSSHYTPTTGSLILQQILFRPARQTRHFGVLDFGAHLTPWNIDAWLAYVRRKREEYRRSHAGDVQDIDAVARSVLPGKTCQ